MMSRYFLLISLISISIARAVIYSGPIVVDDAYVKTNGPIVIGNYAGTLTKPAITIKTTTPIIIINSNLQGPADLIYGENAHLRVINCNAYGTNPNVYGGIKGMFVHIEKALNLMVKNCVIQGVSLGVYVNRYVGDLSANQTIKILNNRVSNIDGRQSDGNNGYLSAPGSNHVHAFQVNGVTGLPGIEIAWNEIINQPRISYVNDTINIYNSSGTSAQHILIHDNYVQGAYPVNPGIDSYVGGGIICDGKETDPAKATAFVDIYNNQVVATANYGLAIASGHDNSIYNNRVVACGHLGDGTFYTTKFAVGIYNWNATNQPATAFFNNIAKNNNPVGLVRPDATGKPQRSDWWLPGQSGNVGNVSWQPTSANAPTIANEASEYQTWLRKVKAAGQVIGNNCSN